MYQGNRRREAMYQGNHTMVAISQGNRKGLPLPYAGLVSEIVAG